MSIVLIGALLLGIALAIPGLILLFTKKEHRIIGAVLLGVGCLFAAGSIGTFILVVSRMG